MAGHVDVAEVCAGCPISPSSDACYSEVVIRGILAAAQLGQPGDRLP